jgi:beta-mannosidase
MQTLEIGALPAAEVRGIPAPVPGSVQRALWEAGLLPDWNLAENARLCEWVENRHWIYETVLPDRWLAQGKTHRLNCLGLDYSGWIFLNGREIGAFCGTHVPYTFDLTSSLQETGNRLRIVFDLPPRWLGQFGFTSQVKEWKTRFNYTWDWQPRLVQIGIWDAISLEVFDGIQLADVRCIADADPQRATGCLRVHGHVPAGEGISVRVSLDQADRLLRTEELPAGTFNAIGISWHELPVDLWWPNGQGEQPLYSVTVTAHDQNGREHDRVRRRVGFRHIAWNPCEGAPEIADPWICVVNGRPIFLQGVNCPPRQCAARRLPIGAGGRGDSARLYSPPAASSCAPPLVRRQRTACPLA